MKNQDTVLHYQTIAKANMPPMDEPFLLWLDALAGYGGLPVIAKRVKGRDGKAYIRYQGANGERLLQGFDVRGARWSHLPPPYVKGDTNYEPDV